MSLLPSAASSSAAHIRSLRQRVRQRGGVKTSLPVTIKFGVPIVLLAFLAYFGLDAWHARFAYLRIVDEQGAPITAGKLEFFAFLEHGGDPSPSDRLGELTFDSEGALTLGPDLVPKEAIVRIRAEGFGIGYAHVETGGFMETTELGPPARTRGRVIDKDGVGVADARVVAFGGGARGVPLIETRTDKSGHFVLQGYSARISNLLLRVLGPSFAVLERDWNTRDPAPLKLRLRRTLPVVGRLVAPKGVVVGGQRILVYRLPGVEARVEADGSFRLDHLPPRPKVLRLLLSDLVGGWTHARTMVHAGDRDIVMKVVREAVIEGRVLYDRTGDPVAGAAVVHSHGPRGEQVAWCDGAGRFRIERVPPGEVSLRAEHLIKRRGPKGGRPFVGVLLQGRASVAVAEGATQDGVEIRIR